MTHSQVVTPEKSPYCQLSGRIKFPQVDQEKGHRFEVPWGQQSSVIRVSACTVLFSDIRVQTGSLTFG